jgi:hypothetical protein
MLEFVHEGAQIIACIGRFAHALLDRIDELAVLGQKRRAFRRNGVQLLVAIGTSDHMAHIEQHGQQRIDGAGTGRIGRPNAAPVP